MAKVRRTFTAQEFEQRFSTGEFDQGSNISIRKLAVTDRCKITTHPRPAPKNLEFTACRFPDEMQINGSYHQLTIKRCINSTFLVTLDNESFLQTESDDEISVSVDHCELDYFGIYGPFGNWLSLNNSYIRYAQICLDDVNKCELYMLNLSVDVLEVTRSERSEETSESARKSKLELSFFDQEADSLPKKEFEAPALTVRRYIRTDIPEFATFAHYLCPTTSIRFMTHDMKRLL